MPEPTGPQFSPEKEPEQEKISEKQRKEKEAFLEIAERFKEKSKELENRLKKDPTFEAKGRKFEMENETDFLVASAQSETKLAQELREQASDYYQKKAAAKLIHFLKAKTNFLKAYAELKSYYPQFAEIVEQKTPISSQFYKKAQTMWNNFTKN